MLRALRIRNLALLEDVDLELGPGLTLLTGETGAGKTILVEALGLVLGERAAGHRLRSGAAAAEVQAVFDLGTRPDVVALLEEAGADAVDGEAVVRRVVTADGRSRAHLNGSLTSLGVLRKLGAALVERHGRNDQQSLLRPETHRVLLDRFGGLGSLVASHEAGRHDLAEAEERLGEIETRLANREERLDLLRVRVGELDEIDPEPGEEDRLTEERVVLRHAERVRELAGEAYAALYDDEDSALARAGRAASCIDELRALGAGAPVDSRALEEVRAVVEDAALTLRDLASRAVSDPGRLEAVEERLASLEGLRKRYGSLEEARKTGERMRAELAGLEQADASLDEARGAREAAARAWTKAAGRLAEARGHAGRLLVRKVERELAKLAMAGARMSVEVGPADGPEGPTGVDRVRFLLAANPGEAAAPLDRVASGGELSRVMLALHGVLQGGLSPRTLVFDEVDAGVGGRAADEVGARLSGLAERHQVLCVTHVPQIARRPGRHLRVSKQTRAGRTRATVEDLGELHRVEEIARMIGGRQVTDAARRHATELLDGGGEGEQ
jgi:DNA repair protein RecN (Recombination protein N)